MSNKYLNQLRKLVLAIICGLAIAFCWFIVLIGYIDGRYSVSPSKWGAWMIVGGCLFFLLSILLGIRLLAAKQHRVAASFATLIPWLAITVGVLLPQPDFATIIGLALGALVISLVITTRWGV
ncbi:MAG: hypothetical protein AB7I68_13895 [Porticoccaceae bacterium]